MKALILTAALAFVAATPVFAQSLTLEGPTGQTATVTAEELAKLPRVSVDLTAHGETHTFEGPLLIDVLAKVGAPTGKDLRGPAMADVVLVESSDGYRVTFGLAEADPNTRPNRIILADKADGAPLAAGSGPFRVVVEGDLRSARMVTAIRVLRLSAWAPGGAAQPEHKH